MKKTKNQVGKLTHSHPASGTPIKLHCGLPRGTYHGPTYATCTRGWADAPLEEVPGAAGQEGRWLRGGLLFPLSGVGQGWGPVPVQRREPRSSELGHRSTQKTCGDESPSEPESPRPFPASAIGEMCDSARWGLVCV